MDPKRKLLVVVDVGSRTLAMAQRVVHQVTQVLAPDCVLLFLTDGFKRISDGHPDAFWLLDSTRTAPGHRPDAQAAVDAAARAALRADREIIPAPTHRGGQARVVFGTQLAIEQVLAACGWTFNTAFVERLNLDIRQRVAAIGAG